MCVWDSVLQSLAAGPASVPMATSSSNSCGEEKKIKMQQCVCVCVCTVFISEWHPETNIHVGWGGHSPRHRPPRLSTRQGVEAPETPETAAQSVVHNNRQQLHTRSCNHPSNSCFLHFLQTLCLIYWGGLTYCPMRVKYKLCFLKSTVMTNKYTKTSWWWWDFRCSRC